METADEDEDRPDTGGRMRLDKWLWAARFFKTRSAAAAAVDGGKVDVGAERAKRARLIRVGDVVTVRRPPFEQHVVVRGLSDLRGPASVAATLWEETPESRQAREKLAFQLKNAPTLTFTGGGRPTKRDRREIEKVKTRW
jgi:ribosome-associated heat shock protein Hsp15